MISRKEIETAENAIRRIAGREGKTEEEVRKEIRMAMLAGLCSQDPEVQTRWERVPREGGLPTPEEVIAFLAEETKRRR